MKRSSPKHSFHIGVKSVLCGGFFLFALMPVLAAESPLGQAVKPAIPVTPVNNVPAQTAASQAAQTSTGFLAPQALSPARALDRGTMTLPDGRRISGILHQIDDFNALEYFSDSGRLLARRFGAPYNSILVYDYADNGMVTGVTGYRLDNQTSDRVDYFYSASGDLTRTVFSRFAEDGSLIESSERHYPGQDLSGLTKVSGGGISLWLDEDGKIHRYERGSEVVVSTYYGVGELWSEVVWQNGIRKEARIFANGRVNYSLVFDAAGLAVKETQVYYYGTGTRASVSTTSLVTRIDRYMGALDGLQLAKDNRIAPFLKLGSIDTFMTGISRSSRLSSFANFLRSRTLSAKSSCDDKGKCDK